MMNISLGKEKSSSRQQSGLSAPEVDPRALVSIHSLLLFWPFNGYNFPPFTWAWAHVWHLDTDDTRTPAQNAYLRYDLPLGLAESELLLRSQHYGLLFTWRQFRGFSYRNSWNPCLKMFYYMYPVPWSPGRILKSRCVLILWGNINILSMLHFFCFAGMFLGFGVLKFRFSTLRNVDKGSLRWFKKCFGLGGIKEYILKCARILAFSRVLTCWHSSYSTPENIMIGHET